MRVHVRAQSDGLYPYIGNNNQDEHEAYQFVRNNSLRALSSAGTEDNEDPKSTYYDGEGSDEQSFEEFEMLLDRCEGGAQLDDGGQEANTVFGFDLYIPPNYQRKFLCRSEREREGWIGVINFYSLGRCIEARPLLTSKLHNGIDLDLDSLYATEFLENTW